MAVFPSEDLETLLIDLTFLSYIQEGEKISFSTHQIYDSRAYASSLKRLLKGDSRNGTLSDIKKLLANAENLCNKYPSYSDKILQKLKESKKGIECLITTYDSDPYIKSELNVIIETIDSLTDQMKSKSNN